MSWLLWSSKRRSSDPKEAFERAESELAKVRKFREERAKFIAYLEREKIEIDKTASITGIIRELGNNLDVQQKNFSSIYGVGKPIFDSSIQVDSPVGSEWDTDPHQITRRQIRSWLDYAAKHDGVFPLDSLENDTKLLVKKALTPAAWKQCEGGLKQIQQAKNNKAKAEDFVKEHGLGKDTVEAGLMEKGEKDLKVYTAKKQKSVDKLKTEIPKDTESLRTEKDEAEKIKNEVDQFIVNYNVFIAQMMKEKLAKSRVSIASLIENLEKEKGPNSPDCKRVIKLAVETCPCPDDLRILWYKDKAELQKFSDEKGAIVRRLHEKISEKMSPHSKRGPGRRHSA